MSLQPPYPLTHLERRAIERGEWTLVLHEAEKRVYFFNPKTRVATRHLQPLLLSTSLDDPSRLANQQNTNNSRSSTGNVHHNITAAKLPQVPEPDSIESLRAALAAKDVELATANRLVDQLQRECLLLRYATVAKKLTPTSMTSTSVADRGGVSSISPEMRRAVGNALSPAPTSSSPSQHLLQQHPHHGHSALGHVSDMALNVLAATPLRNLSVAPVSYSSEWGSYTDDEVRFMNNGRGGGGEGGGMAMLQGDAAQELAAQQLMSADSITSSLLNASSSPLTIASPARRHAAESSTPQHQRSGAAASAATITQTQHQLEDRVRVLERQLREITAIHLELLTQVQLHHPSARR